MRNNLKFACTVTAISASLLSASAYAVVALKNEASVQGTSQLDTEITQRIRQQIVKQNHLSVTAKYVKIITNNGAVILIGPVSTVDEKNKIQSIAAKIVGENNVTDEIAVLR